MIFHNIVIDVSTGTCTGRKVISIPQGDKNAHEILIKLTQDGGFYHIPESATAEISFYDSFDKEMFTTTAVKIANPYRGYVTYTVGVRLLQDNGRYVGTLSLFDALRDRVVSVRFIVEVTKESVNDPCVCPSTQEVVITAEFYKELVSHLKDEGIHITEADRDLLDFISDSVDIHSDTILTYDGLVIDLNDPESEIRAILSDLVNDKVIEEVQKVFGEVSVEKVITLNDRVDTIEEKLSWDDKSLQ